MRRLWDALKTVVKSSANRLTFCMDYEPIKYVNRLTQAFLLGK